MAKIGIASMGEMGATIAYSLIKNGHEVFHASRYRSKKTVSNAGNLNVTDLISLTSLFENCEFIFCIVTGGAWFEIAEQAIASEYKGTYVDLNGLYESDIDKINAMFKSSSVDYVDGAVRAWPISEHKEIPEFGTPAFDDFEPRTMYLTGKNAKIVSDLFDDFWIVHECQPPAKYVVMDIAEIRKQKN